MFAASLAVAGTAPAQGAGVGTPAAREEQAWSTVQRCCNDCHNATDWAGGVAFDTLTPDCVGQDARVREATLQKLRVHLMPPPDKPQPTQAQLDELSGWLTTRLDHAPGTPHASYVPVQRLNRTGHGNAVRSLLAVEISARDLLPPEIEVGGFDRISAALSVSPAFLDEYVAAARHIADIAVGSATPKVSSTHHPAPTGLEGFQEAHVIGGTGIAQALLSHGASPDPREAWRGQTALMWAAAEGIRRSLICCCGITPGWMCARPSTTGTPYHLRAARPEPPERRPDRAPACGALGLPALRGLPAEGRC